MEVSLEDLRGIANAVTRVGEEVAGVAMTPAAASPFMADPLSTSAAAALSSIAADIHNAISDGIDGMYRWSGATSAHATDIGNTDSTNASNVASSVPGATGGGGGSEDGGALNSIPGTVPAKFGALPRPAIVPWTAPAEEAAAIIEAGNPAALTAFQNTLRTIATQLGHTGPQLSAHASGVGAVWRSDVGASEAAMRHLTELSAFSEQTNTVITGLMAASDSLTNAYGTLKSSHPTLSELVEADTEIATQQASALSGNPLAVPLLAAAVVKREILDIRSQSAITAYNSTVEGTAASLPAAPKAPTPLGGGGGDQAVASGAKYGGGTDSAGTLTDFTGTGSSSGSAGSSGGGGTSTSPGNYGGSTTGGDPTGQGFGSQALDPTGQGGSTMSDYGQGLGGDTAGSGLGNTAGLSDTWPDNAYTPIAGGAFSPGGSGSYGGGTSGLSGGATTTAGRISPVLASQVAAAEAASVGRATTNIPSTALTATSRPGMGIPMMPMGAAGAGGAGANSSEKQRNKALSPDEDVYEDKTEVAPKVLGVRPRRPTVRLPRNDDTTE